MITINQNIIDMLNSPARHIDGRVALYNYTTLQNGGYSSELVETYYDNGELIDFKVERVAEDSKFFGFGICQKLTVRLMDRERIISINKGQVFEVSYGVDGDFVSPYPVFQVEEVARDENTNELTVTAYDFLYKANEHRVSEITITSYNLITFVQACAKLLNLTAKIGPTDSFRTSYYDGANFQGNETLREVLNAVAEATQTIYFIDWDLNLVFKRLDKSGTPVLHIDRSKYFELKNKTSRTLTAICHATELGDNVEASTGEPGVTQYVRNNPFWDLRDDINTLLNTALTNMAGITISQFDCSWRGNFALEIGDKVSVETKDGETLESYVINDTTTYNGGLREQTQWSYNENSAETANNPVSLGEALRQTYARVDKANQEIELLASKLENTDLGSMVEDVASLKITTDSINSEVKRVETKLDNSVTTLSSNIEQTAENINLSVSKKVDKDEIISAINLSTEGVDISADKINLNGYVTVSDLSGNGTTTINGSNITTGTISGDRINLTGSISFGDLDSAAQNKINSIENTADAAYYLAANGGGGGGDVPNYIKSTYIDATEIRSPTITGNDIKVLGTFQTVGASGGTEFTTGYVGAARGKTSDTEITYGIALATDWNSSSYDVSTNYMIVTNAGARMQGGENRVFVTPNGIWLMTEGDAIWLNNMNIGSMTDFVIEQGESGGWTYRKWNSGIAECWCKKSIATTITTAWGSLYTSGGLTSSNLTFPFTFSEIPVVNVSTSSNGAGCFVISSGSWGSTSTTSTGIYELVRGTSSASAQTYVLNYQVTGNWK